MRAGQEMPNSASVPAARLMPVEALDAIKRPVVPGQGIESARNSGQARELKKRREQELQLHLDARKR